MVSDKLEWKIKWLEARLNKLEGEIRSVQVSMGVLYSKFELLMHKIKKLEEVVR